MSRLVTYEQYMNMLSERVLDNSRQLRREVHQRRNGMEDLYGICFSSNGDGVHPATFYISLSPDYVYLQRFAFKFVLKPYASSVAGVSGGGSMTIGETSLAVSGGSESIYVRDGTSTLYEDGGGGTITPNPHTHSVSGSIGGLDYGIKTINSSSKIWQVVVNDTVDITPYLLEQQNIEDGVLFGKGNGVYPDKSLSEAETTDGREHFYDILDVASTLIAEGNDTDAEILLRPEFKKVEIKSNAPFGIDAYLYMKYSNMNR